MKTETIIQLLVTKFHSCNKKEQDKLLSNLFSQTAYHDHIYNILDKIPVEMEDKGIKEGDFIYIPITLSMYPPLNINHYRENNLILNDEFIKVFVEEIQITTSYLKLRVFLNNDTVESTTTVWYNSVIDQRTITILE